MNTALLVSMFLVGLATSVHCVSMCGPMVVTYAVKGTEDRGWLARLAPNAAYQAAKLVSYVLVGTLLGFVGKAFDLDGIRPWAMLVAGLYMLVLGLGMTGRVPWAARFTPRPPRALITALSRLRRRSNDRAGDGDRDLATPVAFGLLTGLMPCAPLMAAEIVAAGSGSPLNGGLVMLAFGIGTMPLLFAFGMAAGMVPKEWKSRMALVMAVVVMGMGLVFLDRAALLTGFPVNSGVVRTALAGPQAPAAPAGDYRVSPDGFTEVPLVISNTQFQPAKLSVPAGVKVRLLVDRREDNACSDQIAFPQLGITADLKPNGITPVELPATDSGTYTMTCGMGMMAGQLVVGSPATTSSGNGPSSPWLVLGLAAMAGVWFLARKPKGSVVPETRGTEGSKPNPPAAKAAPKGKADAKSGSNGASSGKSRGGQGNSKGNSKGSSKGSRKGKPKGNGKSRHTGR